jgi:hypothetical protein
MLLILNNIKTSPALSESLLFLGVSEWLGKTKVSLLRGGSDLYSTLSQVQLSLGYRVHINCKQEELSVRLEVGVESYFSLLVGCKVEKREGSISEEILELWDHLTLRLRASTNPRNHNVIT